MFIMNKKIFLFFAAFLLLRNIAFAGEIVAADAAADAASAAAGAVVGVAKTVAPAIKTVTQGIISGYQCTTKKCSKNDPKTVTNCFMVGAKKITDNPHCSNAYYNTFCKTDKGDVTACSNIKIALNLSDEAKSG